MFHGLGKEQSVTESKKLSPSDKPHFSEKKNNLKIIQNISFSNKRKCMEQQALTILSYNAVF